MARMLVAGALAWDRPVWLDAPIKAGARVAGRSLGGALQGRLGGGGANAGAALVCAGHDVAVFSLVSEAGDGPKIMEAAARAGLDLSAVARHPGATGQTLLLIDPAGERIVLGLDADRRLRLGEVDMAAALIAARAHAQAWSPDALYVRSPLPGATSLMDQVSGPVVVHWPTSQEVLAKAAILVGSADDLPEGARRNPIAVACKLGAQSLRACIVTQGAGPVIVEGDADRLVIMSPPATVRDATGAGDIFAAGLLDALCAGAGLRDAVLHACLWGAAAVAIEGSAPKEADSHAFRPFRPDAP